MLVGGFILKAYKDVSIMLIGGFIFEGFQRCKQNVDGGFIFENYNDNHKQIFRVEGWFDTMMLYSPSSTKEEKYGLKKHRIVVEGSAYTYTCTLYSYLVPAWPQLRLH